MNKVFCAYAKANGVETFLNFPASPYEMLDALDRLRLQDPGGAKLWIDEYYRFRCLGPFLSGENDLLQLNALAQKLSELEDHQQTAFEGLLAMEAQEKKNPLDLPKLIDLAYSTKCCHVIGEALNDSQLGRFCAENLIIPDVEKLSPRVFEMLDFEQIGRDYRREKGGILVERDDTHPGGYVERHSDLIEAYKDLDLTLHKPDYAILLKVSHGPASTLLKLPTSKEAIAAVPQTLDEPDWLDLSWECLDCRAPSLMGRISTKWDAGFLNQLARTLADMSQEDMSAYKALLEATQCENLLTAARLTGTLDNYILSPQYSSPIEVAKGELSLILGKKEASILVPHLDLPNYGKSLMKAHNSTLTSYGLIERKDSQPIQAPQQEPPKGGMTLA